MIFVVLYRRNGVWVVFAEDYLEVLKENIARCRAATASAWIWWGPKTIGMWLIEHPTTDESQIPNRLIAAARRELDKEIASREQDLQFARSLRGVLEPRPTQREVRKAQKAAASRRRKS